MHSSPMGLQFAWDAWESLVSLQKSPTHRVPETPMGVLSWRRGPGVESERLSGVCSKRGLERRLEFGKVEPYHD